MKSLIVLFIVPLFCFLSEKGSTPFRWKGEVINASGRPIGGARVSVRDHNTFSITGADGGFQIELPGLGQWIQVSAAGYADTVFQVKRKDFQTIRMTSMKAVLGRLRKKEQEMKVQAPAMYDLRVKHENTEGMTFRNTLPHTIGDEKEDCNNREGYAYTPENRFLKSADHPLSTFSVDVDGASYSNVRRMLLRGQLPPQGAVRIEEMINYFPFTYPKPQTERPFRLFTEMATCPWNRSHQLVMVSLQGRSMDHQSLPPANLVFLVDVSGSMNQADKLPLVKASLRMLAGQLRPTDRVSLVVYAGAAGMVLPSTTGKDQAAIINAIESLEAGGSTAGAAGIQLAYQIAQSNFIQNGNNRVILCTDGDFNVGMSSDDELVRLIEKKRETGVFLTVLGFGSGNYQDAKMQLLANKGNGQHAYIDQLNEARKVFVHEFGATIQTIAKDVKIQVEFNPAHVQGYRLIGYENRLLSKEAFNDDRQDAGEIGSGHTVTAFYEVIPAGQATSYLDSVDRLKYQQGVLTTSGAEQEWMTLKLRYKEPGSQTSQLVVQTVKPDDHIKKRGSENFRFASAVAAFGMLLRSSEFCKEMTYDDVAERVEGSLGTDPQGYRKELLELIKRASEMSEKKPSETVAKD